MGLSPNTPKVPREPRQPLTFTDDDFTTVDGPLFRIHNVTGEHPVAWGEFRMFGPLDRCRWDHHPPPRGEHPGYGLMYAAVDYVTPFAEVFQQHRRIILSPSRSLAGWETTRPLRLLNLASNWPLRNGAARSLQHAPRSTCRAWARAIHDQCAGIDGLAADSTLTGEDARGSNARVVVLWESSADHFPQTPSLSRALDHPALSTIVLEAVKATGYEVGRAHGR